MGLNNYAERMKNKAHFVNYNKYNVELQAILILIEERAKEGKYSLICKISDTWIKDKLISQGFDVLKGYNTPFEYIISWNE